MALFSKVITALMFILILLNGIIFVGSVIDLLERHVGFLSKILWIVVAPLMSPAVLGLPWFDAWVSRQPVNDRVFLLWVLLIGTCGVRGILAWRFPGKFPD